MVGGRSRWVVLVAVGSGCGCLVALGLARLHQCMEVELVGVAFSMNLGHDVLVVVIPEKKTRKGCHELNVVADVPVI